MNYYERHLGDYARDTAHLTMLEHGAYSLLLDRYYATEHGIPDDQAHRLARARSREERAAVDAVLREFFTLNEGVWISKRCEAEIAKLQVKVAAARTNGKRGGRPKRNPEGTQEKPSGFSVGSISETQQKALQTPDTKHQTPEIHPPYPPDPATPPPDGGSTAAVQPQPTPGAAVCLALRQAGIADCNPSHPLLLALLQAGATPAEFVAAAGAAAGKAKGFAYTLAVVEGQRKRAADAALALHHGPLPMAANGAVPRPPPESFYERDTRLKRQRFLEMVGRATPPPAQPAPPADVVEIRAREVLP